MFVDLNSTSVTYRLYLIALHTHEMLLTQMNAAKEAKDYKQFDDLFECLKTVEKHIEIMAEKIKSH